MGLLGLAGLRKRFGAVVIASGIDLDVQAGEAVGILGPNGAGKTSLFGMITGTLRPDGGQVFFEGVDVTALPPEARCRRGMARSFQVPQPFGDMSVFENLLVGAVFLVPAILGYTFYSYWVFRGKISDETHYH